MSRRTGKTVYQPSPLLKAETTARSPLRSENAANTNWTQSDARTFVYDSWNLVRELHAQDSEIITNHYVWGIDLSGSLSGAGGIGGLLASCSSSTSHPVLFCYDANGNVSELLDVSGGITAHYEYSPFGETIVATGPLAVENKFRFSTKVFDDEIGLAYYGYRYYNSGMGRWLNPDTIGELGGINVYVFVKNDPLNQIDDLGLFGNPVCGPDGWYYPPDPSWGHSPEPQGISETCSSVFCVIGTTIDTCYGGALQRLGIDHVDITHNGSVVFVGLGGDIENRMGSEYTDVNHKYPLSKKDAGKFSWGKKKGCSCKNATDEDILDCLSAAKPPSNYNCQGSAQAAVDGCCLSGFKTLVSSCFPTW